MTTRDQLAQILAAENIEPRAYDISGAGRDEAYCLERSATGWVVFYRERGLRRDAREFASEGDACAHLIDLIRRDPTTRR